MSERGYGAEWRDDVAVLSDAAGGVEVHVCPAFGNTILRFRQRIRGEMVDLLAPVEARAGFRGGSPTLFPTPNRVRNARYTFGGRTAKMVANDGEHRLHGLVFDQPWTVDEFGADDAGTWLWARYTLDSPAYPWPCVLQMGLALTGGTLYQAYEVHNTGNTPMPFGVGAHPWFVASLGGARAETRVRVPGRAMWELDPEQLPTGRLLPVAGTHFDLRAGPPLGANTYDHVYTNLIRMSDKGSVATIQWGDVTMVVGASPPFREWVVYAPADRPVVCLEPYTCTTDAVNLEARGLDAGLKVLKPGATWEGRLSLHVEHHAE